jgi:hypothetical protein
MQFKFLKQKKGTQYKNSNTGAIIEFGKSMMKEKEGMSYSSMLPPTLKGSKKSK